MTAQQIKKLRTNLKLSQINFAKKIGVSRRTAQSWESKVYHHAPSRMAVRVLDAIKQEQENQELPP